MTLNLDETQTAVKVEKNTSGSGVFTITPLPQGFGHTLGNTLRRVLLSSLKGSAISQVKFSGVSHQFTTIPGVKEDVVDLTLNLKQVRLKIEGDQPVALTLSQKGPGEVTAGDLKVPAGVEVANPNLHLATLADKKAEIAAEMVAEPGRGYLPCEGRGTKLGLIPLDCIFSPVLNVSYKVEPTRVGQVSDYDQLTIEISTDKTIEPLEALTEACQILNRFFVRIGLGEEAREAPKKRAKPTKKVGVEDLELPLRILNSLRKANVSSANKLGEMGDEEITEIKNIGKESLKEIRKALKKEVCLPAGRA